MKQITAFLFSLFLTLPAMAGSGTINYTNPGSGTVFATTTDGLSQNYARNTLWDYSAAANGLAINSSHQMPVSLDATNVTLTATGSGSAGTPAAGVISIQGIGSMTPVQTVPSSIGTLGIMSGTVPGTAPTNTVVVGAMYNATPPSPTDTQTLPLNTDSSGNLKVNIAAGGAAGGTSSSFSAAFPSLGTAIGAKNGSSMVNLVADGSGNLAVVELNSSAILTAIGNPIAAQTPSTSIGAVGISDGACGSPFTSCTTATVKAASTSAVATDKSLVVQINPQQTPNVAVTTWAGGTLGAMANYNSDPGSVLVPGVNAAVTKQVGVGATGASVGASATQAGCAGSSAEPTAVTNGQLANVQCTLAGRIVTAPYSIKENQVRGTATTTGNTGVSLLAAGTGSNKTYVTDLECWNSSATNVTVTFNDVGTTGSGTVLLLPASGGWSKAFQTPLVTAAATALTFTSSLSETTIGCNAQGYYAL